MRLGYLPRLHVLHTSSTTAGQVYMPAVNWTLFGVVVLLVLEFQSSSRLGSAYGFAVSGTMLITTALAMVVARRVWKWSAWRTAALLGLLFAIDMSFLAANSAKILEGGWFPLALGALLFAVLTTWKRGRDALQAARAAEAVAFPQFLAALERDLPPTVPGTAVFLRAQPNGVPSALLHNLKHNRVLHERVVLANVNVLPVPRLRDSERVAVRRLNQRFYCVNMYFGFMERPDVPGALEWCAEQGLALDPLETSYFLGREMPSRRASSKMACWRRNLFVAMARNAGRAAEDFMLPANRVVELGATVAV
jgi:KUP system potassium uptake protein